MCKDFFLVLKNMWGYLRKTGVCLLPLQRGKDNKRGHTAQLGISFVGVGIYKDGCEETLMRNGKSMGKHVFLSS